MKDSEITVWVIAALGLAAIFYLINQNTDSSMRPVPEVQGELQFNALGIGMNASYGTGTLLDMSQHHHGWHPGYDPDSTGQPVTQSKVRYPTVAGGNISTIMHRGWSSCVHNAPNGENNWFLTPPEAAIA
jgi:hypothetical protein